MWKRLSANPLISFDSESKCPAVYPPPSNLLDNPWHRSRGNLVRTGYQGERAVTSHRGSGFHGPEGVRQAGMPAGANACDRQTGRPYVFWLLTRSGDMGPVDGATDTVTGAEAQSLPPPDAKGSGWVDEPPIIKIRLVVATLPSSRLFQKPDRKRGVAAMKRAYPRPRKRGEVDRSEGPRRRGGTNRKEKKWFRPQYPALRSTRFFSGLPRSKASICSSIGATR